MKKVCLLLLAVFASFAVRASAVISESTARVRWPFASVVDIDFRIEGTENADVVLSVQWDGLSEPMALSASALSGSLVSLPPGYHHFEWNPKAQGCRGKIKNARLIAQAFPVASRTYLVVDLATGDCSYLAEPPADGGFSADVYKTDKMVFRRIPAGTYQVGDSAEASTTLFNYSEAMTKTRGPRTVKVTTDYYLAIYQMTGGQVWHIDSSLSYRNVKNPYTGFCEKYRGSALNGVDNILWPGTGHRVADGSVIDLMRKRFKLEGAAVLDLPTSVMWEIGARAGSATAVYPNGGAVTDTTDTLAAIRAAESLSGGGAVGQKDPNPWSFYDLLGISYEMVLDVINWRSEMYNPEVNPLYTRDLTQVVDPVGLTATPNESFRYVNCNAGWSWDAKNCTASWRVVQEEGKGKPAIRPCIYLKPFAK